MADAIAQAKEGDALSDSQRQPQKISAFVLSYNRENLIEASVAGLSFADEVLLIDKSSTDRTREVAAKWVDRIIIAPWTPSPGETLAYGLTECKYDWILCLADDECLNIAAIDFITQELSDPRADIYLFPTRDYILGRHDENAYYWPHLSPRMFRKGAVEFKSTIHGALQYVSESRYSIPTEDGAAILHFSHESTEQWIEKTNRYTSEKDRVRLTTDPDSDLLAFAHRVLDQWAPKETIADKDHYVFRVAILRAIYDIVDRIKELEQRDGIDGLSLFRTHCREMILQYAAHFKLPNGRTGRVPTATTPKARTLGSLALLRNALRLCRAPLKNASTTLLRVRAAVKQRFGR